MCSPAARRAAACHDSVALLPPLPLAAVAQACAHAPPERDRRRRLSLFRQRQPTLAAPSARPITTLMYTLLSWSLACEARSNESGLCPPDVMAGRQHV